MKPARFFLRPIPWCVLLGVVLACRVWHRPEAHTVFPILSAGADHWWNDASLYLDYKPLDYFRYPPALAVAFTPFAWLGPCVGGIAWAWLSLGIFALGLRRFVRDVLPGEWDGRRELAFVQLSVLGALAGLWNGQSNALLAGLLLLGTSSAMRGRWWPAATLLSLPVTFKLTPLPLVLLLCALWPRQLTGRLACCVLAGLLLPFLTRPPDVVMQQYQGLVEHLADSAQERWPGFRDGWTVWVVLRQLASGEAGLPYLKAPMDGDWYRLLQAAGGLAVLAGALVLKRRGVSERALVTLTLAGGAGWLMLLGPAAEWPTFAFLAPLLAWALTQRRQWPGRRLIETAGVCVLVLGWGSLTRPFWDAAPWLILALPVGTSLFLAWVVRAAVREYALTAPPEPLAYRVDAPLSLPELLPCRRVSSSCLPRSARDTCGPPRPSSSPCARPSPAPTSRTSTS